MKKVLNPNRKGASGEKLVLYKLSKVLNNRFYFSDSVMLGEKHEIVDIYACVDRIKNLTVLPYCFIQVKTTTGGNKKSKTISVQLTRADVALMIKVPAPTYLAAVDLKNEKVYIRSVNGESQAGIYTVKKKNSLDDINTMRDFRQELIDFWKTNNHKAKLKSKFI